MQAKCDIEALKAEWVSLEAMLADLESAQDSSWSWQSLRGPRPPNDYSAANRKNQIDTQGQCGSLALEFNQIGPAELSSFFGPTGCPR